MKKKVFCLLLFLLPTLLLWIALPKYFSIEFLRLYHTNIKIFVDSYPVVSPILFCFTLIMATMLSLPGVFLLAFVAGYLFPEPYSALYTLVSATIGSTILVTAGNFLLRKALMKKATPFLEKMKKGFLENATHYLLFLRLIPFFPFWMVNVAAIFFRVPIKTFIWTTCVGTIPEILTLTFAGKGLEKVMESSDPFSISAIFNVHIKIALLGLAILTLIPLFWKRGRSRYR